MNSGAIYALSVQLLQAGFIPPSTSRPTQAVNPEASRTSATCISISNIFAAAMTSCNSATLAGTPPSPSRRRDFGQ